MKVPGLKSRARSLLRAAVPIARRQQMMEALERSPLPSFMARILPPCVRIEGCLFFTGGPDVTDPASFFEMITGTHESAERRLARNWFLSGIPLVDLGAGLGTVSVCAAAALDIPHVIACEPNPDLVSLLRRNMAVNRIDGVVVPSGIWYGESVPRLGSVTGRWTTGSLAAEAGSAAGAAEASPITLSALLERYLGADEPFQLLCDIEGMEWELFRNETDILARRCVRLVVELHSEASAAARSEPASVEDLIASADAHLREAGLRRSASISVVAAYAADR